MPSGDSDALAHALRQVSDLPDDEIADLGREARRWVEQEFSASIDRERMANSIGNSRDRVLRGGSPTSQSSSLSDLTRWQSVTTPTRMGAQSKEILIYCGLALFVAWCLHSFGGDVQQIRFDALHGGWWAVVVAAGLSLLNYALRIQRWRLYLQHLGHRLAWRFCALSYMAGFAFTLSPGKVGEMVRARYYTQVPLNDITAAFSAERLMDLIAIMLLALGVLVGLPAFHAVMWAGLALTGGVVLGLLSMPWRRLGQAHNKWVNARGRARC